MATNERVENIDSYEIIPYCNGEISIAFLNIVGDGLHYFFSKEDAIKIRDALGVAIERAGNCDDRVD